MGSENAGARWCVSHTSTHYVTSLSLAAQLPVIISTAKWHPVVVLSNIIAINRCYTNKYSTQCSHIFIIKHAQAMFRGQMVFSNDIENSWLHICSSDALVSIIFFALFSYRGRLQLFSRHPEHSWCGCSGSSHWILHLSEEETVLQK